VFIAMGAAASALAPGRALIETLGGLVLVFLGLWMLGAFKASFLYRDARFHLRDKPAGFFGSFLVGAAFGAGWTPCVGPILAGILVLASREGSVGRGVLLLTAYSAGFAVPLLACAAAVESGTRLLKRVNKYLPWIEKGTGVLLVLLGVLLAARMYGVFAARLMSALRF
jgi:cytochrome c-type biogenesis protein